MADVENHDLFYGIFSSQSRRNHRTSSISIKCIQWSYGKM